MQTPHPNIFNVIRISVMDTPTYTLDLLDAPHVGFGVTHWSTIRLASPTSICCISLRKVI